MLNEQSAVNLPMDPSLQAEIEAVKKHHNHIKIMGDNANMHFLMQPQAKAQEKQKALSKQKVKKDSKKHDSSYQVHIQS